MEINDDQLASVTEWIGPISIAPNAAHPPSIITINLDGEECGRFFIKDGKIQFEGDFGTSAVVFFMNYIQPLVDDYLERNNGGMHADNQIGCLGCGCPVAYEDLRCPECI